MVFSLCFNNTLCFFTAMNKRYFDTNSQLFLLYYYSFTAFTFCDLLYYINDVHLLYKLTS